VTEPFALVSERTHRATRCYGSHQRKEFCCEPRSVDADQGSVCEVSGEKRQGLAP